MSKFWTFKENYNGDITFGEVLCVVVMIGIMPLGLFIGWALAGFPPLESL